MRSFRARLFSCILMAPVSALIAVGSPFKAMVNAPPHSQSVSAAPRHAKLQLKDGSIVEGEIIDQSADVVRFKGKIHGIDFITDYLMSNIEKIVLDKTGVSRSNGGSPDSAHPGKVADNSPTIDSVVASDRAAGTSALSNAHRVYFAELKGKFGRNITQTLIRKLTTDARKENADTIIFSLDGAWDSRNRFQGWNELLRFEDLAPALTDEIQHDFPTPPRVATWVHRAMGGASLIPLCNHEIYMTSDGIIGGMSGLDLMMQGDRTVVEKQRSLRLQHAAGWVIKGGYDRRILYAMAVVEYVLSYRYKGDQVEYFERMPEGPDEVLLTDAGPDTLSDIVRGRGKAYLDINAKIGRELKVSRGTADSKDDLFFLMGLDRNRIDVGSAAKICEQWDRRVHFAESELLRLWREEYNETRVQGSYEQRTAARGKRKRALSSILEVLNSRELEEVFDSAYLTQLQLPSKGDLQSLIYQIDIEQQSDRR